MDPSKKLAAKWPGKLAKYYEILPLFTRNIVESRKIQRVCK